MSSNSRLVLGGSQLRMGFPQGLSSKEPAYNTGNPGAVGLIPGSGRFLGGEHNSPLQYSCLKNPMDRGVWWATVHEVIKSLKQLSRQRSTTKDEEYSRPRQATRVSPHTKALFESWGTDFTGNDTVPSYNSPQPALSLARIAFLL